VELEDKIQEQSQSTNSKTRTNLKTAEEIKEVFERTRAKGKQNK